MRRAILTVLACLAFGASADEVQIQKDAPERYTVKKGDTLWDIAERFLKDPWKWPEVWQRNRAQIRNPHRIYPGDVIRLTLVQGKPRLSLERSLETVRLSPRVHAEPIELEEKGIPAIDPKVIVPFLGLGAVLSPETLESAPKLLGADEERRLISVGDRVYASPGVQDAKVWQIYRPGREIVDPDTQELLGLETHLVGEAHTVKPGELLTLEIDKANQEITVGDRLLPHESLDLSAFVPHAPTQPVSGKIISIYGGITDTSQYAAVMINKGARDGLEPGHVLAIHREGRVVQQNPTSGWNAEETKLRLPEQRVGLLLLYRVYPKVAYGLIMKAYGQVQWMDRVSNP